ncbi:ribbon-helix-helix domain-containing protein [Streptomyces sp. PgraA7]|uniref:ribbon-helix-helix domain-containing protein n=1 Tax=unclassified Streptomyces TaxID=2593676 RepID=UPI0015C673C7|nr:ribbon-helix-helix domain-containing protein [Streptomyces sp. PgraA7]
MEKATVYLPDEWEARLNAESSATGVSKAELIRRGIAMLLDSTEQPKRSRELPVFDSGRSGTPDEMDNAVCERIRERAARR